MDKKRLIIMLGFSVMSSATTAATLQTGDHLSIDAGSFFTMAGGAYGTVPLLGYQGISVGVAPGDTGSGSRGSATSPLIGEQPQPSDIGAVTQPWAFFGSIGYDYLSPDNGSGSFGGDTTNGVDMTSWTLNWLEISSVPVGGCQLGDPANNFGYNTCDGNYSGQDYFTDTGTGLFSWSGVYGDSYTITYTAHIPKGDPSYFGGIQYDLYLTGIVTTSTVPIPATLWLFTSGLLGLTGLARRRGRTCNTMEV